MWCGKYHPPNSFDMEYQRWMKAVSLTRNLDIFQYFVIKIFLSMLIKIYILTIQIYTFIFVKIIKKSREGNVIHKIFKETKTILSVQNQHFFF